MAKRIRFALKINNVDVRNLEALKENFDLEKVIAYFLNGQLLKWLEDRYYDEEAEKIRNLDKNADNFAKKLYTALGVEYTGEEEPDLTKIAMSDKKLAELKKLTADEEILSHATQVAFSQEDLADLLEDDEQTIYLCGKNFVIPASFENRKYIGILGKPDIKISIKTFGELKACGITFENVNLPENLLPPPPPPAQEIIQGRAIVDFPALRTYFIPLKNVNGKFYQNAKVRILRKEKLAEPPVCSTPTDLWSAIRIRLAESFLPHKVIYEGTIKNVDRCGITIKGKIDVRYSYGTFNKIIINDKIDVFEGDIVECYRVE